MPTHPGPVRVRFAPSPTGLFHVGGARSALFNWAMAKRLGGRFVLRIEDTDAARNRPEWTDGILSALSWLGIDADDETFEGPYFQSEQTEHHQRAIARLLAEGKAYHCVCTREDVRNRTGHEHVGYDGHCRRRGLTSGAVRLRTPDSGLTAIPDLVRGRPTFDNAAIEDFVIARGDGSAPFLLANTVDDITMGITHVVRGEEHLPNAARQQLLAEALGARPPVWAHVPVIVNEERRKLSKRRDKVALEDYRAEGILPAAMRNYLMLLGWSPRGDEIQPFAELVRAFDIADVSQSPAFFDERKLRAFNGDYLRALSDAEFIAACRPFLAEHATDEFAIVAPHVRTRISALSEVPALVAFLFTEPEPPAEAEWEKAMRHQGPVVLAAARAAFLDVPWTSADLHACVLAVGESLGLKLAKAQAPVRMAVTGRAVGLPLFESLAALGRERVLRRIDAALDRVGTLV